MVTCDTTVPSFQCVTLVSQYEMSLVQNAPRVKHLLSCNKNKVRWFWQCTSFFIISYSILAGASVNRYKVLIHYMLSLNLKLYSCVTGIENVCAHRSSDRLPAYTKCEYQDQLHLSVDSSDKAFSDKILMSSVTLLCNFKAYLMVLLLESSVWTQQGPLVWSFFPSKSSAPQVNDAFVTETRDS